MVDATGAKILAHRDAKDQIPEMDIGIAAGDVVKVGKTVELEAMGHAGSHDESHMSPFADRHPGHLLRRTRCFNAGAGHCKGGGHPDSLYTTFASPIGGRFRTRH